MALGIKKEGGRSIKNDHPLRITFLNALSAKQGMLSLLPSTRE